MFKKFPFTCDWLRWAFNNFIYFVDNPIIGLDKKNDYIKLQTGSVDQQISDLVISVKNVDLVVDSGNLLYSLVSSFDDWKVKNIDNLILEQEKYSSDMCDILLKEINEKYKLRELWLSVVFLIYLLLFGFVRILMFFVSFVWFIMFKIFYRLGFYKIEEKSKKFNDII